MISHLGSYSLIFCTIFAFLIILQSAKLIGNQSKIFPKKIYTIITLQLFFVIFSFSCLLIAFVSSDFSNITVYNNSHTEKPFFYKISGVWGNHEGSLLLWLLVLVLFLFYLY